MDHMIKDCPLLKEEQRRNSKKHQELASKAFKKAMKATWGETSDEESEGEDGESNLALMAKSDTDSDSESSEVSLSGLKTQVLNLSKRKVTKLLLSLIDERQQMSVEKVETLKNFSSLKSEYKFLKREKIELENVVKALNAEISKLEETVSVQKTENSKMKETVSSLKAELNTIKERETSSSKISNNDQDLQENEEELKIRQELENSGGTNPQTSGRSRRRTGEETSSDPVPET
ncbi:hypothetical protein HAX54_030349 [Datura stramonium]|uniref:Uncharacterized protein n=1 Tax=Datura stramonium TaxID=4076 RepID=A0ABS8RKY1_DATST|nr:hypothetical protein [Datura stramonium]